MRARVKFSQIGEIFTGDQIKKRPGIYRYIGMTDQYYLQEKEWGPSIIMVTKLIVPIMLTNISDPPGEACYWWFEKDHRFQDITDSAEVTFTTETK